MDKGEIAKQLERQKADRAAEEAKQNSRKRAKAAVRALNNNPEDAVKIGNQWAQSLIASFDRLHSMQLGDHPALIHTGIKAERNSNELDSSFFRLGDSTFVAITKITPSADGKPNESPHYRFSLSTDLPELIISDGTAGIPLGDISTGKTEGLHPAVQPALNRDEYLFNNLVNIYEAGENMKTVEQELGLEPLPPIPFEVPQAA